MDTTTEIGRTLAQQSTQTPTLHKPTYRGSTDTPEIEEQNDRAVAPAASQSPVSAWPCSDVGTAPLLLGHA